VHIHEATTPPVLPDEPLPNPGEPTAAIPTYPAAPAAPVAPLAATPVDPMYDRRRYLEDQRKGALAVIAAVLALVVGGLLGFLIGRAVDDEEQVGAPVVTAVTTVTSPQSVPTQGADIASTFDMLLTRTRADGEFRTPSEFPQLDEIIAIDTAAATAELEDQVALLTAAQQDSAGLVDQVTQLEDQVTQLEETLATTTAERDQLAAQLEESGDADTDTQAQLDAATQQIDTLEADLEAARSDLDAANTELQQARADLDAANAELQRVQAELDAANAQLDELNVIAVPRYIDGDVERARADATANGWTLIEQPLESEEPAGSVLDQAPPPDSNMITGSVLNVTVATGS